MFWIDIIILIELVPRFRDDSTGSRPRVHIFILLKNKDKG